MDLRIGIQNSPREIAFETSHTAAEVEQAVSAAVSGQSPVLRLADAKGTVYVVPAAALAYVEIGTEESRKIGFVG
ncbi:DUF3107 domain-containing protein [Agromyces marinus]|uniref:DUF3107 domain-containing protein n=1 Tax=Agromyces marinus TaxID=1389020 RepID=UPI001F30631B|nr:DUF3107 domain-containing protein [Agromyces marinus]UIP59054.1 hypothetical protein DSM26151_19490 [Agromyces marinus]